MPGLAAPTGTLTLVAPAPTVTVTGTELLGVTVQGTWKVICCWPAGFVPILRIGAVVLLKLMLTFELVTGNPGNVDATLVAPTADALVTRAPRPHGDSEFGWRSAPLTKFPAVIVGAGGVTARENVWLATPATDATTVAAPWALSAVTFTCARPLLSVVAVVADRDTGPLEENCTVTPTAGPLLVDTCTTSGCANAVITEALWLFPETMLKLVIVTGGVTEFTVMV